MTKIKKALLSVLCCFALIFCSAFVFTACTKADMTAYNITIDEAIQSGWVKVIGDPIAGEEITIVLNPDTGYEIVPGSLKVNGKEIVGNKFIMPEGNVNVTAKFKKINYAVNTGNIEHGTVDIEVSAQEIASGDSTEWGAKVTLTPVPEKGYECTHLEVLNGGLQVLVTKEGDKYSFNMPQGNITINATFEKITYSLTKASEHGTFTIPATANYGDTIEVTGITPDAGYLFSKIKVNGNTISGTTFTMPAQDTTVTVEFKAIEYNVSKRNPEHGKITLSKTTANYGDTITVTVTPDAGYTVSAIKVNGTAISGNSFVVTENSEVTVELTANQYSIEVSSSENGSVIPNKTTAIVGEIITLTISPNATYNIETLTIKNGDLDIARSVDGNTVTFTMPAGDVTISATFAQNVNAVNISASENGNVSANPVNAVEGSEVELNITPNTGYKLETLVVMYGETPVTVADNKFVMPAGDVTVSATFKKINYTIIKSKTTNGSFTVQETATYGESVTISVTPATGYELDQILVDGEALEVGETSFIMPAHSVTITVTFKQVVYTIERTGTPEAHGTFEIQDTATYGEEVVITSNPEAGYEATYTVMCGETPVVVTNNKFTMPAGNVTISVSYTPASYTISVYESIEGNIENGSVSFDQTIAKMGDEITITVEPDEGYSVKGVAVLYDSNKTLIPAKTENENEYVFTMIPYDVKIRAWFGIKNSITANEATNGTVEITGVTSELDGTFTANATEAFDGDTVTITATPSEGFVLKSLKVNNGTVATTEISEGIYTFSMPAEQVSVNAEFEEIQYTITKNKTTNGSFSVQETATYGENVTISVTPATGYVLDQILVNGVALGVGETSFTMPANDVTVSVTFKIVNYTIAKSETTNGSFTVQETATYGENVTISVTPATGYELNQILVDGVALGVGETSFIMPASNVTVSVIFKNINYAINKSETTNGSFSVQETATYGENVTISVTPATGYELDQILVDGVALEVGTTSFTMPAKDVTVSVTFKNINYTINKSETTNGSFTVQETATYGENVTISVTPATGYVLDQILVDGVALGVGETSFIMPANDVTVGVTFKIYTLELSDITYTTSGTDLTITKVTASATTYEIPSTFVISDVTYTVKSLRGTSSGGIDTDAVKVILPSTLTSIGQFAFKSCRSLESIEIPDTVTIIAGSAFLNCTSLASITIPNGVTNIGISAFKNTYLYNNAHDGDLIYVSCADGKKWLLGYKTSFSGNLVIPDDVVGIAVSAFDSLTSLRGVAIGNGVTSIGDTVFMGCVYLEIVEFRSIIPPVLGTNVFYNCSKLSAITVPNGTKSAYVTALGEAYQDKIIEQLSKEDIEYTTNGTDLTITGVTATTTSYAIPRTLVIDDVTYTVRSLIGTSSAGIDTDVVKVILPSTLTSIGNYAFKNCTALTSIVIPDNVISIGDSAFNGCVGLGSVLFSESVKSIGQFAFRGCSSLTSLDLSAVTTVGGGAFENCTSLIDVTLHATITSIEEYAFNGCSNLKTIFFWEAPTPPTFGNNVFYNCTSLTTIYVPAGTKSAYVTALGSDYESKIVELS